MHFHRHAGHDDWHHATGRGPGHHGGGWGHGPRGGRGGFGGNAFFRVGKMIADGDLRLIVLALLADGPRHGYDIIKAIEERSSGIYTPSPGVVYPTLTYLEEVGYAVATSEGNKKVYAITDSGRAYLEENRDLADTVLHGIETFGRKMARARDWWDSATRAAAQPDRDIPGVIDEVNDARRELKAAIAEKLEASEEEQRRVAAILRDAAAAIRQPDASKDDKDIDLG